MPGRPARFSNSRRQRTFPTQAPDQRTATPEPEPFAESWRGKPANDSGAGNSGSEILAVNQVEEGG